MLRNITPLHLAIALLLLAAMAGAALWAAVRAHRRPKPRGIRVDLVGAPADAEPTNQG